MNRDLEFMIPLEYQSVERSGYIGDDHFLAKKDGKYGIITKKNKIVLPFIYDQILQADYNNPKGPQIKVKQGSKEFYVDYDYLK
ncbi:MAG: WG repeat-containing protein [Bacteroidetes bacterium]|nr:WG repeat-containing protein [Bacteroidota bacterium]